MTFRMTATWTPGRYAEGPTGSGAWSPSPDLQSVHQMPDTLSIHSKLPDTGVSIFAVMSRLATKYGAVNMGQGAPDFDCDPALIDDVARYMRDGHNQYAPMAGVPRLREALAAKIADIYGHHYDPATEITITAGATEGLYSTLTALVHPGDEVILFPPAYDAYVPVVKLSGGTPVFVPLRAPDYRIDWDEVRRRVSPRTRVILINSPHNPTGMVVDTRDVRELVKVLDSCDAVVVADEVYEHIVFDGRVHVSLASDPEVAARAVVISSFGKTYHTTGWKVGYCAAPRALSEEIQKVHQFVTFTVNGALQLAYADAVARDPACAGLSPFYQAKRDRFLELIAGTRFRARPCGGTYFQLLDYSEISDEADDAFALRLLRQHGVASIPLSPFTYGTDFGPVLRFCFAKQDDTLEHAAKRMAEV
jgi:methionine aminotransferase